MRREGEAPHYLQSTASSRAKEVTLKKEEKAVAPMRKLYVKSNDPDDSVPVRPSVAKTSHEVKGTLQEEEKRRPLYLATTASMRAMTLPTKKYVKRESRLPPRMMLKKRTMSSSEASEEEKKNFWSGEVDIVISGVSSEALKQKEEEKVTHVFSCILRF